MSDTTKPTYFIRDTCDTRIKPAYDTKLQNFIAKWH